ncbi:DUF397 domain-containing protein [Streptomyces sp. ME19-01-6]|uniref:DUF397 domain-containing protein n=1 Tax=Streptomyces sp. ME19-01-6 TaxID=3028686 RepID=UPI0029A5194A|nr:DUF397 domain-containing protein [Streptomyces sp. ME19-01-6]MDX3230111.1 DUF397 domain-containing protein [Streptomyces sp. ME19-01-6]
MTKSVAWRKSSFSGHGEADNCVELAVVDGKVWLRESDTPTAAIRTTPAHLGTFIRTVKAGALEHLS